MWFKPVPVKKQKSDFFKFLGGISLIFVFAPIFFFQDFLSLGLSPLLKTAGSPRVPHYRFII